MNSTSELNLATAMEGKAYVDSKLMHGETGRSALISSPATGWIQPSIVIALASFLASSDSFAAVAAAAERHVDRTAPTEQSSTSTIRLRASSSPAAPSKLEWRPTRRGTSGSDQPVRTVRYEEDVFSDGPALSGTRTATLTSAPTSLAQTTPDEDLRNPFERGQPTTPTPTPAPMPEPESPTTPMPFPFDEPATPPTTPPSETPPFEPSTPPPSLPMPEPSRPEFRPRITPSDEPTPSPLPGDLPRTTPDPLGQPTRPDAEPLGPPQRFERTTPQPFPNFGLPDTRPLGDPADDCAAAYEKLKTNTIDKLNIDIRLAGKPGDELPYECALSNDPYDPRRWRTTTYTWKASALCHKPIYFEDVKLERYGHSHGPVCEYFASAAHFFGDVILLPYNMGVKTPTECEYTLGYYRPGNCAPYMLDPFPFSLRGAAFGALGYGATIAIFP